MIEIYSRKLKGCVYEITNPLYLTLTRAHFSLDRRLPLLPFVARFEHNPQTDKAQEIRRDKTTLCFRSTAECLFLRINNLQ